MRWTAYALLTLITVPTATNGQILRVAEMSVRDLSALDRDQTVVIVPGGILEEHGPYLPSFNDGYMSGWVAERTAEAILAERGGTVLMFPTIPLGVGSPEDFAGVAPYSGSYTIRPETLRAVYMDLSSAIGRDGFRTIFVINGHGSPSHNWALLEASEYFADRFGGTMVPLMSLVNSGSDAAPSVFTQAEAEENGVDVHAGATETSRTLFLHPELVHDDVDSAAPHTARSLDALVDVAESPTWTGYFGSPRVASPQAGAQLVAHRTGQVTELALRILDGFDWRGLPTSGDRDNLNPSFQTLDQNLLARSGQERLAQEAWIDARQ